MPNFDIQKTAVIDALVKVPREERNQTWVNQFFAALPDASLATTDTQVFRGPDGMQYFDLHLPEPEKPFTAHCMAALAEHCTNSGLGLVINPQNNPPDWVFSYGDLWHLRTHGKLALRVIEGEIGRNGDQVMVAAPSDKLLPPWARTVLKSFLDYFKVQSPGVLLIVSQKARPAECVVFNVHAEDFPPDQFQHIQRLLAWFIPPHLNIAYVNRGSQFEGQFTPL